MSELECCGHRDGCVLCGMTPTASQSAPPAHHWRRRLPDCWISAIRPNFVSSPNPATAEVKKRRTRRGRRGGKNRRKHPVEEDQLASFISNDDSCWVLENAAATQQPTPGYPTLLDVLVLSMDNENEQKEETNESVATTTTTTNETANNALSSRLFFWAA